MPTSQRSVRGCFFFLILGIALLICCAPPNRVLAQEGRAASRVAALAQELSEEATVEEGPAISFPEQDMERGFRQEAASAREHLKAQTLSLMERKPLGFDLKTVDRLREWALDLPLKIPEMVPHLLEQSRLLGFAGSLVLLAFLVAVFYSLFGQQKVLDRLEKAVEPLRPYMTEIFYPFFLSLLKIVVASLIPLILFGAYSLIRAFISYEARGFLITGNLLMLWALGALLINLLREALMRQLLPISVRYGQSIFRLARVFILYILFCFAVFMGAEVFQIPQDILSLLKFVFSLSIVLISLLLLLKKKAILGVLPDLPYKSYQVFVRVLGRFYFPAIFLTFLTGLLWCVGYQALCKALWKKTWAVAGAFLGIMVGYHLLQGWLRRWLQKKDMADEAAHFLYRAARSLLLYATVTAILLVTLDLLGLFGPLQRAMSFPVLKIGQTPISLWTVVKAALILVGFIFTSRILRAWLDYKVYPSVGVDEGLAYAINTFVSYVLIIVGFLFALRAVGLDLRVLMVFAGALGIGVGLGLQNVAANIISGFILVFGRRIRKGDLLQVGDTVGHVREVGLRATRVRTYDNVEYLIPNSGLTSQTIVNYTLSDPMIRVHVPVGVSYGSDPKQVERILVDVANNNPDVIKHKPIEVWFTEYGDSSLNFTLLVWTDVRKVGVLTMRSRLYYNIFEALKEAGIEIPFPQRDLHIRTGLFPAADVSKE